MEILFCDICNESVPAGDLETGHAFRRNGRVVCAACDRAMSEGGHPAKPAVGSDGHAGPSKAAAQPGDQRQASAESGAGAEPTVATRGGGGGAGGVVVGLLALAFAGAGFALMIDKLDVVREESEGAGRALQRDLLGVRQDQDLVVARVDATLAESAAALRAEADENSAALLAVLDGLRAELLTSREDMAAVSGQVTALRDEIGRADGKVAAELQNLGAQVIDLERDMRFYSERMIELEETLRGMASRGPLTMPSGNGGGNVGEVAGAAPAWQGLVTDLQHANAGIRLDAVYALGETKDDRTIDYLVPALKDDDLFVRMATARVLMDLDARVAVPSLIDALEDTSSAVREAAMVALRKVTGKEHKFDPLASEGERSKRVKAWRDWWEKNAEDFLSA